MPRAIELSKRKREVLQQIELLRSKLTRYVRVTITQLREAYREAFPCDAEVERYSREFMVYRLLMAATFHMTDTLGLE